MIKRIVLISLAIVLILSAVAPATALAKKRRPAQKPVVERFAVIMTPTTIDSPVISSAPWPSPVPPEANSWPIVDMIDVEGVPTPTIVGWVVGDRSIYGGVTGDMGGSFTFTYGGILDTLQSGSIQGIVTIQTARGIVYLAARGTSEAVVTGAYAFAEIMLWWGEAGEGQPLGLFFSQIYNSEELALIPDGNLTLADIQAWCEAVEISLVEFIYSIYGDLLPPGLDGPTLAAMYSSGQIPPLPGLQFFGGMYGDVLPPLPKTLSAEFSGTVRVDAGTGAFSRISGSGKFKAAGGKPLTLQVLPSQHVYDIDGAIQMTGTYSRRSLEEAFKVDRKKLRGVREK